MRQASLDSFGGKLRCPKCGSTTIIVTTMARRTYYKCLKCKKEWKSKK